MSRALYAVVAAFALTGCAAPPAPDGSGAGGGEPGLPSEIALPAGFQPEGIATDPAGVAYLGSLADGDIYRADLRTGAGAVVSQGPGTPSVGMKTDPRGRLFVAGGPAGDVRVVDTRSGAVLASYRLADGESFVNDVVLTGDAAWFTDSFNPVLYRLPLRRDGVLPAPQDVQRLPLTGDLVYVEGFNVNGIATTPDGSGLLVVQSNTGLLFRVDPATGATRTVDLGGETLVNGDGLLNDGRRLYVVQNRLNTLTVVELTDDGTSGRVTQRITDPRFDVPTTVARSDNRLYLPNARLTTPPTPTTAYSVVSLPGP